ncbi:MAG: ABC transporter permease [Acidobacteriia bacterium]|nr:ABC transporter permease [Terriglobia bacterium]
MDDELRFHLEMQIERNVDRGMSPGEARHEAMVHFGGIQQVKEECRDARMVRWLDEIRQDLRYACRSLHRKPGFTITVALTLSLGIGANTAIFSTVNSILLRPLPYRDAGRLVTLLQQTERFREPISFTSPADIDDLMSRSAVFEDAATVYRTSYRVIQRESPENVEGADVSPNLFALLGITPARGRLFLPEDDEPRSDPVAVLSHSYWLNEMGGDPEIIGRKLNLDGKSRTVIGVLPADFRGMFAPNDWKTMIWTPDGLRIAKPSGRNMRQHVAVAHLRPGVSFRQAQTEIDAISGQLASEYPETNAHLSFAVQSLHERIYGDTRAPLLILMAAVGLVLLIASANVANLLLARSLEREKEIAIRASLGAGRWRVMRQLLTESIVLSISGGAIGALLAIWAVSVMRPVITGVLLANEIHVDLHALGFTLALSCLTGISFGLLPAWQAARLNLTGTLKDIGRRTHAGRKSRWLRQGLVASQIALSIVLLLGAGLLLNSLIRLLRVDPGFKTDNLLCMFVRLPRSNSGASSAAGDTLSQVLERVRSIPGVQEVALTSSLPLGDSPTVTSISTEDRPSSLPGGGLKASAAIVSPQYVRLLGLSLRSGRFLSEHDTQDAPQAVVINERLAKTLWPNEGVLGRRIVLGQGERKNTVEVVGVVSDARHDLTLKPMPQFYQSYLQSQVGGIYLVARANPSVPNLAKTLRETVQTYDRRLVVGTVRTMEQATDRYFVRPRFYASLFGILAAVALLIALVGTYGVMSYTVAQRTHEIGVRMALGAQVSDILRLVIGRGMLTTSIGLAIGLGAGLALTRLLKQLVALYGVTASDPATFAGIAGLFVVMALPACYLPARRAIKIEPVIAVKYE